MITEKYMQRTPGHPIQILLHLQALLSFQARGENLQLATYFLSYLNGFMYTLNRIYKKKEKKG